MKKENESPNTNEEKEINDISFVDIGNIFGPGVTFIPVENVEEILENREEN